jgi:hypothetical protein
MHNRGAQVSLTDIIGWTDIRAMQEDEQAVPVFMVPFQESFIFGLLQRVLEQPVAEVFNPLYLRLELRWRESISLVVQMDCVSE